MLQLRCIIPSNNECDKQINISMLNMKFFVYKSKKTQHNIFILKEKWHKKIIQIISIEFMFNRICVSNSKQTNLKDCESKFFIIF